MFVWGMPNSRQRVAFVKYCPLYGTGIIYKDKDNSEGSLTKMTSLACGLSLVHRQRSGCCEDNELLNCVRTVMIAAAAGLARTCLQHTLSISVAGGSMHGVWYVNDDRTDMDEPL